jgi:hypothetical protein
MRPLALNLASRQAADCDLPDSRYIAAINRWELWADFPFYDERNRTWLLAYRGFRYDYASNIRPLWWFLAPHECGEIAPLFHDLLYRYRGVLPNGLVDPYRKYTRAEADLLFFDAMRFEQVPMDFRRNCAYPVLRLVGRRAWRHGIEARA